jgi:glutamyl-tRNA synthetase
MTDAQVRVRFPPSPTGYLHVGSVRTALYNWLYARHVGGVFVFRIEDTDETRHIEDAVEQIQRSLRWVGIDWDEGVGVGGPHGPYVQSERRAQHMETAERLLSEGHLYRCYCTPEELAADREQALAAGRPAIYSGRCRDLTDEQRAAFEADGRRPALRLRAPEHGETVWDDLVRGEIRILNATVGDHIVVRSDGVPTYNFVNPLDDAAMEINHVIRGEDLLPSTPRQIHLYQAIGAEVPRFGHLPMVLGPDRKRLSKRHGATSVEEFRDAGYLPEAVINGLALVGWSLDDSHEFFTREDLVRSFSIERVNPAPGVFDHQKLEHLNGLHIRHLSVHELAQRIQGFLEERGSPLAGKPDVVRAATPLVQEKIRTLAEFEPYCAFLFGDVEYEEAAWQRLAGEPRADGILETTQEALGAVDGWTAEAIETALRGVCERLELKPRVAFGPVRVALTGRTVAPGLFESAELLGRDETLKRLAAARERLQPAA